MILDRFLRTMGLAGDASCASSEHQGVLEIAPWYVNGTVGEEDRRRIEVHLAKCESCRDEVATLRELDHLARGEAASVSPHPARYSRFLERVEKNRKRRSERFRDGNPATTTRGVWTLVAVQSLVVLGLATLVLWDRWSPPSARVPATNPEGAEFRALHAAPAGAVGQPESPAAVSSAVADALVVRAVFASGVRQDEVAALVEELGGRVVSGPSSVGVFVLEVALDGAETANPEATAERVRQRLERFREDPRVRFASWPRFPAADSPALSGARKSPGPSPATSASPR